MSVIFGIKEKEVIFVAGDKRASDIDGAFISDEMQKVTPLFTRKVWFGITEGT